MNISKSRRDIPVKRVVERIITEIGLWSYNHFIWFIKLAGVAGSRCFPFTIPRSLHFLLELRSWRTVYLSEQMIINLRGQKSVHIFLNIDFSYIIHKFNPLMLPTLDKSRLG